MGWSLVAAAFALIGIRLYDHVSEIGDLFLRTDLLIAIGVSVVLYQVALLPIAGAWGLLLAATSGQPLRLGSVFNVYGRANIAKYFPGNVLHFAGRNVLGKAFGWPQVPMAFATLAENAFLLTTACLLALILGWSAGVGVGRLVPPWALFAAAILMLGVIWTGLAFAPRLKFLDRWIDTALLARLARSHRIPLVILLYAAFFIAVSLALVLIGAALGVPHDWHAVATIGWAFALGWLVGTVTPGAPGGLGVREAGMLFCLQPIVADSHALVLVLSLRIVTTLGDALLFVIASAMPVPHRKDAPAAPDMALLNLEGDRK